MMLPDTYLKPFSKEDHRLAPIFSLGESESECPSSSHSNHHRAKSSHIASLFRKGPLNVSTNPTVISPETSPTSPRSKPGHSIPFARFPFASSSSLHSHATQTLAPISYNDLSPPATKTAESLDKQHSSHHSISSRLHSAFHSRSSSSTSSSTNTTATHTRTPTTTSSQATSVTSSPTTPLPPALVQSLMTEKLLVPSATSRPPSSTQSSSTSLSASHPTQNLAASSQPTSLTSSPNCPSSPNPARAPVKETHHVNIEVHPVTGRKLLNTYDVLKEIGRGQHGKVKLAQNIETGELVVCAFL